ncbi:hypothetical protein AB1Y20_018844 [Prymnesium parvum]|uniref:Uncharacterized protein n=1 Tax=Prymnesium parvum TaxID=97485 RepID=A0AB34JST8_PRYPA
MILRRRADTPSEQEAHAIASATAARTVLARRSTRVEAHALDSYDSPAAIAYTLHSVRAVAPSDTRPASDMMSTAMIIDTGASLHLENYKGEDGYKGRHVQYVLGDAPGYEVIQLERPNVAMRSDFRKALWSPSVAFKESGIESYFNARPHLKLPDGRRIPVLEDKALYACLRAWLDPPTRPWASYLDQPT